MHDRFKACCQHFVKARGIGQIPFDKFSVQDSVPVPGGKVVIRDDVHPRSTQHFHHVRADIAGSAHYKNARHWPAPLNCLVFDSPPE